MIKGCMHVVILTTPLGKVKSEIVVIMMQTKPVLLSHHPSGNSAYPINTTEKSVAGIS